MTYIIPALGTTSMTKRAGLELRTQLHTGSRSRVTSARPTYGHCVCALVQGQGRSASGQTVWNALPDLLMTVHMLIVGLEACENI